MKLTRDRACALFRSFVSLRKCGQAEHDVRRATELMSITFELQPFGFLPEKVWRDDRSCHARIARDFF